MYTLGMRPVNNDVYYKHNNVSLLLLALSCVDVVVWIALECLRIQM